MEIKRAGKRVTRLVDNLTLAREVESAIKSDFVRGRYEIHTKRKVPTLNDIWERYLPWAKTNKKSWKTDFYYYEYRIKGTLGNKRLDSISPLDLERFKHTLLKSKNKKGKPYAPATVRHYLVIIRRLFNLAIKWDLYNGPNPVSKVKMPRCDNQKTEFLTDEELARLLEVLEEWPFRRNAAFVKFALFTGLRRGELFKLKWGDVNFEQGYVTLRDPKGGRKTSIPLSPQALDALKELERTSEYVFPGRGGKQLTDFKNPWDKIKKAAELPEDFRFHGLRHHFASALVSSGVDITIVKELLTHKSLEMTQRYAHLAPDVVKEAARKSGEILTKQGNKKIIKLK